MLRNAKAINYNDLLTESATENKQPLYKGNGEKAV